MTKVNDVTEYNNDLPEGCPSELLDIISAIISDRIKDPFEVRAPKVLPKPLWMQLNDPNRHPGDFLTLSHMLSELKTFSDDLARSVLKELYSRGLRMETRADSTLEEVSQ